MVLGAPLPQRNDVKNIFISDLISYGDESAPHELRLIQPGVGYQKTFHEKRKLLAAFTKKKKKAGFAYRNSNILIGFFEALPPPERAELMRLIEEFFPAEEVGASQGER